MKKCSKCVLPESTPKITFDENGICNYCRDYIPYECKGEAALVELLDSYRKPTSRYDCIVPISGGRDSMYTLLKLVKDYRMKVLAVNYNNPFSDPQANVNIDRAIQKLNVDLIRFQLKRKIHEKSFKRLLQAWFRKPNPALIPVMCSACHLMWYHIIKIARKNDIHLLISGNDPFEETAFKIKLVSNTNIEDVEKNFTSTVFGVAKETMRNLTYFNPLNVPVMVKGYLFGNHLAIGSRIYGRRVKKIELFSYIPWDEKEILSKIKSELDWNCNPKFDRTWRFDCKVTCLKDFMYMNTLGITERDDLYAKQVREGLMTREEAFKRLEKENKIYPEEVRQILDEIGMAAEPFINAFQDRSV